MRDERLSGGDVDQGLGPGCELQRVRDRLVVRQACVIGDRRVAAVIAREKLDRMAAADDPQRIDVLVDRR